MFAHSPRGMGAVHASIICLRLQVGMGGAAVCYSYSCSKGVFAGVSIEGSLLTTRNDVNLNFYGAPAQASQAVSVFESMDKRGESATFVACARLLCECGVNPHPTKEAWSEE